MDPISLQQACVTHPSSPSLDIHGQALASIGLELIAQCLSEIKVKGMGGVAHAPFERMGTAISPRYKARINATRSFFSWSVSLVPRGYA
jgi:hypothetical protein